ncbi:hypothetical protein CGCF415_v012485 [Colletotrichum fructicola]|uniref:Uncharacterized protein n=1 Tax=Colletotrichum fructicola (strain Nara gc5) TaxID=1213859 RepID=L2GC02_COLFN|nr:hypothetical protein CGCF415_v012485 [Colletotrichum fructicola]KAF4941875.1 hypothetical protein CGCF245_v001047 [Colletotrichum fructicola]
MTTSGTHGNGIGPMDALPDSQSAWTEVAPHINTLSINIGGGRSRDNDDLVSVRPRYLCIVKDFKRMHYATIKVSDYLDHYGDHIDLDFIFVSYTRMQFRVATEEEIDNYPYESEATRDANREVAQADRVTLIKWGMEAAQRANISAFWIDFECIRNDDGSARSTSSSGDVYHICDIVRAAHSMIIAIGPAASDKVAAILEGRSPPAYSQDRITPWLRQWGSRLWTLPEVLLCPSEHRIQLYALGDRSESNLMIAKRNFAERAWDDAAVVNELVHHFEGTATLTPHHFIEVALECFSRRQTDHFSQGDVAYATMGLFPIRQRPLVDKHDTGFQAFAKLCLCNNNSDFLGCLICLAPQPGEQWFRIGDRWSTKLSEIRPLITIRKVGTGNTIILDNANGFPIHWDGLHPEPYFEENDGSGSAYFFNIALMWCCSAPFSAFFSRSILSNFAGFLPITAIFALVAPVMLLRTRTRIRVPATPRLIGIEGFVDLSTLEKHLWGLNHGNLTDSTPLSYQDIGMGQMQSISDEELHSFTLLDTHLMTVTRFRSSVPPVAMFVVGEEGEKHRTLLCSYDHITQTFHREEVLRCDRRELKKESKLSGVRLSLASQPRRTDVLHSNVRFNRISWWAMEVMFLGICLTGFSLFDLIEYPQWKSNPQPTTSSYRMAMIIGQIPAWMIVSYTARPLETLPYILTSKFILNVLANATEDPKYFAFHGLLDSSLALLLIMAILSWYTLEEVIIRFLLWAILCPRLTLMVVPMEIASRFLGVESMLLSVNTLACVLCVCDRRTKGFSGIFGRPMDVSWLPMDQKSVISSRAAMGKFALGTNTRSLAKVPLSTILSRGALVFAAALLSKSYTGVWSRTDRDYVIDNAVFVLIASALGFVMYRVPSVSCKYSLYHHYL